MKSLKSGFTLIELLIVIALLGVLAVGLLAALDPFEQLKKGTDTGTRSTAAELHGAVIRYYAIKNEMPWCDPSTGLCDDPTKTAANDDPVDTAITRIISTGELKEDFKTLGAKDLPKILVTGTSGDNPTVAVCFQPKSKSFRCDPNTKFTDAGEESADCPPATDCGSTTTCYWCVK